MRNRFFCGSRQLDMNVLIISSPPTRFGMEVLCSLSLLLLSATFTVYNAVDVTPADCLNRPPDNKRRRSAVKTPLTKCSKN